MFEKYSVPDVNEMQFEVDKVTVPVVVQQYEEEYQGSSRGEEYFEETLVSSETVSIECPLEFVYNDANPSEEYVGNAAAQFLQDNTIDSFEIIDPETVMLEINDTKYMASYDAGELDKYKQ